MISLNLADIHDARAFEAPIAAREAPAEKSSNAPSLIPRAKESDESNDPLLVSGYVCRD